MAQRLETPGDVRRAEKYLCPLCGNHRWWGESECEPLPEGEGFAFRDWWGCRCGCLGFELSWALKVEYYIITVSGLNAKTRRPEDSDDAPTS